MSSKKVSQFISIIILIAAIVIAIFVYSQYKSNNQGSDPRTETKNQTSATGSSQETTTPEAEKEETTPSQPALSSKDTLSKFLEIFASNKDKTGLKDYSTTTFYESSLIADLVSRKTSAPTSAQIIKTSSTTSTKVIYQVKEEYNISKTNNSGSNGIYLYTIIKENNKWLVNSKTD